MESFLVHSHPLIKGQSSNIKVGMYIQEINYSKLKQTNNNEPVVLGNSENSIQVYMQLVLESQADLLLFHLIWELRVE